VGGRANGAGKVYQVHALQGEQVSFRNHANQFTVIVDDAKMRKMMLRHQHGSFERIRMGGKAAGILGHYLLYGCIQGAGALGDHGAKVPQCENAGRDTVFIGNDNAADVVFVHSGHGFTHRQIGRADNRIAQGIAFKWRIEGRAGPD